jgi:hypothetical protein
MLYSEIIAVCSEIYTKHINTLCGQNVEFVNVKPGGTYSNHYILKAKDCFGADTAKYVTLDCIRRSRVSDCKPACDAMHCCSVNRRSPGIRGVCCSIRLWVCLRLRLSLRVRHSQGLRQPIIQFRIASTSKTNSAERNVSIISDLPRREVSWRLAWVRRVLCEPL